MKKLTIIIALLLGWHTCQAQLVINELMQSNIDCIMDDLNDFPDSWVELYNAGSTGINLQNYKLGTMEDGSDAWQLPSQMVGGKQYVLIYCDKVGKGLHTSFRLESGKGCEVYLFEGSTIADKVKDLKKQPSPNIAYGRKTDGADEWGYQLEPTPGKTNCGQTSDKILGDPVFSEEGMVITNGKSISLTLSLPAGTPEGAEIRYTLNGAEPLKTSQLYTSPISFTSTRVIRAKIFCEGCISPRSIGHSYIYFTRELTLPVVSILTDSRYLNDSKIGIYVEGNYQNGKKNYQFNWRRPINFEYFDRGDTKSAINQLCETRIMGGATRDAKIKSMAVYANKRFGTKHLNYQFFPDQKPELTEQKSIILRNAGNDFDYLYMRDAIIQRTMASHVDIDWQAWQPTIVYINGSYKGMLNIRERSNEDNIWANYDKLEDIDMIEIDELKEGDRDNYNRFKAFYNEHGHTLAEYKQWMDVDEYLNLMIMNLYYNNQDFPGNNIVLWRPRTEGGVWRWIAKDTDFGLGLYGSAANYQTLEWLYNPNYDWNRNWANTYEATRLFRRLMEDKDIKNLFINRCCIYMGDFMNEKGTRKVWDPMYDLIKTEYPNHRKLVNQWWPNYGEELTQARKWITQRTSNFYNQLGSFFELGSPIPFTINKDNNSDAAEAAVLFNDIPLSENTFEGKFFANQTVTLKGSAPEGKVVTGWNVRTITSNGTITTEKIDGSVYEFVMPACSSLAINAILGEASGINNLSEAPWTWHKSGSQLVVSGVPAGTKVQLFDLRGMTVYSAESDGYDIVIPLTTGKLYVLKVGSKAIKL
ncbi:MAG: CotH kinase family protein [Prevotella sp.]|nr:CotH kinase family protein [Prevotella sp.]